jgi:hypothetical protein
MPRIYAHSKQIIAINRTTIRANSARFLSDLIRSLSSEYHFDDISVIVQVQKLKTELLNEVVQVKISTF